MSHGGEGTQPLELARVRGDCLTYLLDLVMVRQVGMHCLTACCEVSQSPSASLVQQVCEVGGLSSWQSTCRRGSIVRATTQTAPILTPKDRKQAYGYGLDAESIRREFLTHLEITLAELPQYVISEWEPYLS